MDIKNLSTESDQAQWAIREVKAFLDPYRGWVHSLILFGSYAFGHARKHSDVDFMVLLKNGKMAKRLASILFDYHIYLQKDILPAYIQIVNFRERNIEFLFKLSSPITHSARFGVVIWDDGYFRSLLYRPYPKWPTKDYAVEAVERWIIWQYFDSSLNLRKEITKDHGPEGWCTRHGACLGHLKGDILARVISRMLYVTLPAQGFLPLSKVQAREMAVKAYGKEHLRAILLSMAILRKNRGISQKEFNVLNPFALKLFRECIKICGARDPRVLKAIRSNVMIRKQL